MLVDVGSPIVFTGQGKAYAKVKGYVFSDEDKSPSDGGLGEISLTLIATRKGKASLTISPHQSQQTTTESGGSIGVEAGNSSVGGSAELAGSTTQSQESDSGTTYEVEVGLEKDVTPYHDNQSASVGGNKNNLKGAVATANFGTLSDSDCQIYRPSFLEWVTFW